MTTNEQKKVDASLDFTYIFFFLLKAHKKKNLFSYIVNSLVQGQ